MNIQNYLNNRKIATERKENVHYNFRMEMLPGCRFRQCDARLETMESECRIHLAAELPVSVSRREYPGVGADLAALNTDMLKDKRDHKGISWKEGFILDTLSGVIRYELRAEYPTELAEKSDEKLLDLLVHEIAGKTICKYSDSISAMINAETARIREKDSRKSTEDRLFSNLRKFFGFIGLDEEFGICDEPKISPCKPAESSRTCSMDDEDFDAASFSFDFDEDEKASAD